MGLFDSSDEANEYLHKVAPGEKTPFDIDRMSNEEIKEYLTQESLKGLRSPASFISTGGLGNLGDIEASGQFRGYSLGELFERKRDFFIEVMWNTGKAQGLSEQDIVKKMLYYYHRHLISNDSAMKDIEKRLAKLRAEGRIS